MCALTKTPAIILGERGMAILKVGKESGEESEQELEGEVECEREVGHTVSCEQ